MKQSPVIGTIDEYIEQFPPEVRKQLERLRAVIKKAAPAAVENISYRMPTFSMNKHLVHFAAYKKHIGLYPTPSGIKAFEKQLSRYVNSKGAVQFPIDRPLPFDLIAKIVRFRVKEDSTGAKAAAKKKK